MLNFLLPAKWLQIYHAYLMYGPAPYSICHSTTDNTENAVISSETSERDFWGSRVWLCCCAASGLWLWCSVRFWHCLKALPLRILSDLKVTSAFTLFSLCVLKFYSLQHKGAEFPEAVHPLCAVLSGSVRYVQYLKQHFTAYFDHFTYPKG